MTAPLMAAAQKAKRKKTSLCEKSMELVVNIIKLSFSSIANINLRKIQAEPDNLSQSLDVSVSQLGGHKRSQVPGSSKKCTYFMEKDGGKSSSYTISGNKNGDDHDDDDGIGNFSDFIKKVNERNGNGGSTSVAETKVNTAVIDGRVSNYIRRFHERNHHDVLMNAARLPHLSVPVPPQHKHVAVKSK